MHDNVTSDQGDHRIIAEPVNEGEIKEEEERQERQSKSEEEQGGQGGTRRVGETGGTGKNSPARVPGRN